MGLTIAGIPVDALRQSGPGKVYTGLLARPGMPMDCKQNAYRLTIPIRTNGAAGGRIPITAN
ncbi:hypothetical protein [Paraburkholderia acidipaludis]|uniref:hypothetical protein n=1 Tax=Paraburkholderia acidipaludis TaxID=660537 RepID=UPI0012EBCFBC|nr:hypothetical protein [Paraburkholderia acidipaludis]